MAGLSLLDLSKRRSVPTAQALGPAARGALRPLWTVRVMSNTSWFDGWRHGGTFVEASHVSGAGFFGTLRESFATRDYDIAVLNCDLRRLLVFCLVRQLFPAARCRLVAVDPVLSHQSGLLGVAKARLLRRLLAVVDLFIFYHKDTTQLERVYGIGRERVEYVPFKINDYANVLAATPTNEGFILSCGRSYRDYGTFCKALQGLPYEARILAPAESARDHGTTFDFRSTPSNVTVITDDGSGRSWIDWIARSTFVVLPLFPNALTTAGISACLVAMALGKCVIITESVATRGMLDHGETVVVPPSDPGALRAAMVKVSEDSGFRSKVAATGRAYALSLGDVHRLAADVRGVVQKRLLERTSLNPPAVEGHPLKSSP